MTKWEDELIEDILKGEHWEDNLSGLKWTPKLKDAVLNKHTVDIRSWRAEDELTQLKKIKSLKDIEVFKEHALPRMIDASCVAVLKSMKDLRIKEIGFNRADDMFLNNWGNAIACGIHGNTGAIYPYTLYNLTNTAVSAGGASYSFMNGNTNNYFLIQFGAGTTAAARTNYNIQTAFVTTPESTRFNCGPGAYAGGTISFGNLIAAGGTGTVNEIGLFTYFFYVASAYDTFMVTHDILGAGVAFVAGNPLVGTFAISI